MAAGPARANAAERVWTSNLENRNTGKEKNRNEEQNAGKIPQRNHPSADEAFWVEERDGGAQGSKITVNIGLGEASQNVKLLDTAAQELGQITGQKPIITRAKKSIANFKIRKACPRLRGHAARRQDV